MAFERAFERAFKDNPRYVFDLFNSQCHINKIELQ
jgi:hypothetical protein